MSKRWTFEDDVFIHAYFDAVGDFIGPHDLSRPKGSVTRRVARLRATGAWDALTKMADAKREYHMSLGETVVDFEFDT